MYIYIYAGMRKEMHTQQTIITGWLQIIHIYIVSLFIIFYIHTIHCEGNFKMRNTRKVWLFAIRADLPNSDKDTGDPSGS